MLYPRIAGVASYVPDDILDNEMLSKMVDTNDEWITTRVGIKERRILKKEGTGSSYMGAIAVKRLLESTGTAPEEVDLLICATSNPDYRFPSTGSIIAHDCGLANAYAYDIQAACAGFLVALQDAAAYVKSGLRRKVVVVAAEKMSSMTNYSDRSTCPLFGDAAACMLIEPTDKPVGIMDGEFHVNGEGLPHLLMKAGGAAAATMAESKLNEQLSKIGIRDGQMSFTFNADSTFTSTVGKKKLSGTYSYNASTKQVNLKYLKLLNLHAKVNCTSNSLELLFNSDKLLKLMSFIGSKSNSTALKTVSSLADNYDGMMLGFQLTK